MPEDAHTTTRHIVGPGSSVGSYRIVKQIGSGGMGKVFEASHTILRRDVAIKVLLPELRTDSSMSVRMTQEAAILEDLHHPGIVRVLDCGLLEDGRPWIAMELVRGESLAVKLQRETRQSSREVIDLLMHLADVLTTVHARGVIHRDLKPENILFTDGDSAYPLRVIDWGVARLGRAGRITLEGTTFGTPSYMSPEQILGRDIAPPCDIYSLGVIAYEALTGYVPFQGDSLAAIVSLTLHAKEASLATQCPGAPRALCELIHRMLEKTPRNRPTASQIRDALRALACESAGSPDEYEAYEVTVSNDPIPAANCRGIATVRLQPNTAGWELVGEILRS